MSNTNQELIFAPRNEVTVTTSAFITALGMADFKRGALCYGDLIQEIPQRLGSNPALDAAAGALVNAFAALPSRRVPQNTLVKYGSALKCLRLCLADPVQARSPETICAIYLIIICQVILKPVHREECIS